MAYPIIFRKRAFEAIHNGRTRSEVTEIFNLGEYTLRNWEKLEEETGFLKNEN